MTYLILLRQPLSKAKRMRGREHFDFLVGIPATLSLTKDKKARAHRSVPRSVPRPEIAFLSASSGKPCTPS